MCWVLLSVKDSYTHLLYNLRKLVSQLWKDQGTGSIISQHCCTKTFSAHFHAETNPLLLVQCNRKTYLLSLLQHLEALLQTLVITTESRNPAYTQTAGDKSELLLNDRYKLSRGKKGGGILLALHSPPPFPLNPTPPHHQKSQPPYLIISSLCPRKNFWLCSLVL